MPAIHVLATGVADRDRTVLSMTTLSEPPSRALLLQWWLGLRPQQRARLRAAREDHWLPDEVVAIMDGSGTEVVGFAVAGDQDYRMLSPRIVDLFEDR